MKTGTIAILVSIVVAVAMIVVAVPPDEATDNAANWFVKSRPYLFWTGLVVLFGFAIYLIKKYVKRIDKVIDAANPADQPLPADHWAERKRLEISVIANISAHREPNASPIAGEPENSRLRELKDAIDEGHLDAEINGPKPNATSTVTLKDFVLYVAATNKTYWKELLDRWQAVQILSDDPSDELKKRIPLLEFLEIAKMHGWDVMEADGYEGFDLIHGITEAAGLGDLVVLGKKINQHMPSLTLTARLQEIPSEFWRTHAINTMSCLSMTGAGMVIGLQKDNAHVQTECDQGNRQESQEYADLYLKSEGLIDWLENDAKSYRGHTEKAYGN